MAGKAPLLLAMVLFAVGAVGLGFTSAERAKWGPFEPRGPSAPEQRVVIVDMSQPYIDVPSLVALNLAPETAVAANEPTYLLPVPEPTAEPTATPTLPPLRVYGISSDDGGVSAAAQTPAPPPPIRIGGIAVDDEAPEATETPEASETVEEQEATETPPPDESPAAEDETAEVEPTQASAP